MNEYPASCCPEENVSKDAFFFVCRPGNHLFKEGCIHKMDQIYTGVELVVGGLAWLNLLLCAMASTVIICRCKSEEQYRYQSY